ncbi:hypothetical protein Q1695_003335 [Nippostrongylus brasiliensis]|nr:hypothetical protein Q1695_003335 [Nippostrongylus brasiliensis]
MESVDDTLMATERLLHALEEDRTLYEQKTFLERLKEIRMQQKETTEYLCRLYEEERRHSGQKENSTQHPTPHHCPSDRLIFHCPPRETIVCCCPPEHLPICHCHRSQHTERHFTSSTTHHARASPPLPAHPGRPQPSFYNDADHSDSMDPAVERSSFQKSENHATFGKLEHFPHLPQPPVPRHVPFRQHSEGYSQRSAEGSVENGITDVKGTSVQQRLDKSSQSAESQTEILSTEMRRASFHRRSGQSSRNSTEKSVENEVVHQGQHSSYRSSEESPQTSAEKQLENGSSQPSHRSKQSSRRSSETKVSNGITSKPIVQDAAQVLQLSLKEKARKREERARAREIASSLEQIEERSEGSGTQKPSRDFSRENTPSDKQRETSIPEQTKDKRSKKTGEKRTRNEQEAADSKSKQMTRSKSLVTIREPTKERSSTASTAKRTVVPEPIQNFVPQVTVPTPFKFTTRKTIVNTYSTKFVQEMVSRKKAEEELLEHESSQMKPFTAKIVPKSTYIPTNPRVTDKAYVEAIRRRLTATMRKHFEQEALTRRTKSMGDISGVRPVPVSTYVAPVLPQYRRARSASRRAVNLLVEASTPPFVREHTIRTHVSTKVRHRHCIDDTTDTRVPRAPVPDFQRLHAEMEKALKTAPHKATTVPRPFHFSNPKAHRHRECKSSSPPRWRAREVKRTSQADILVRPTHSSKIRMDAIRQRQEKLDEERHRSEKFWEEKKDELNLSRLRLLSSMGSQLNIDEEIERKTAEKKKHVTEISRDYERYLAEMQQRVIERPLIMERQSIIAHKQNFARKYDQRMAAVGKASLTGKARLGVAQRHDSDFSGATYSVKAEDDAAEGVVEDYGNASFESEDDSSTTNKRSSSSASSSGSASSSNSSKRSSKKSSSSQSSKRSSH